MEITVKPIIDFTRVFDIPSYQKEKYPNASALNAFSGGQWQPYSIGELQVKIDAVSCWLLRNGFSTADKIMLVPVMGTPEFMILDYACQQVGVITIPVHPTSSIEEIETILGETEPKLIVAANPDLSLKFSSLVEKSSRKTPTYSLEKEAHDYFQPMRSPEPSREAWVQLQEIKKTIGEDDAFTILYTSGSSGVPKGVILTHRNVVHNIKAILTLLPLEPKHRVLSFLPFSHIFERATCYTYMAFGVSLYFSQNKDTFAYDFNSVRPHFCTCVPRVLEKMYDFLQEQALGKHFIKKTLITWALETGKSYGTTNRIAPIYAVKLLLARVLVLRQWRKRLGGRIRYMAVGAAALRPEIGRLFSAAGIYIIEGYGMTETAPLITINRYEPGLNLFGTVGMTIPGIEVKIDNPNEELEGEILVKGPNVMQGYFNRPLLTKEVFTDDGWFRTGDIGKFVHHRFLQITDRKKDIFKTSSGKYIAPQLLENYFSKSPFIERCLIIGFQRPFVTALVVPQFTILEAWCAKEGIHWTSPQFMVHNIKVVARMKSEVDQLNIELPNFQRIKDFVLCHEDWSMERGEITNTLKPVRRLLEEHYQAEIEKMYK